MLKAARQRAREKEILAQKLTNAARSIDARIGAISVDLNNMRYISEQLLQIARQLKSDSDNV